jgi:RNA polymerase sigma-70 factor (ECF subfamily)
VPNDVAVVERLADAISCGDIDGLAALLAEDAWGIVDGGGIVKTATRPNHGRRAIARQWANGYRRLGNIPVLGELRELNGQTAILIRPRAAPAILVAAVHVETRGHEIVSLCVDRDPRRLAPLGAVR